MIPNLFYHKLKIDESKVMKVIPLLFKTILFTKNLRREKPQYTAHLHSKTQVYCDTMFHMNPTFFKWKNKFHSENTEKEREFWNCEKKLFMQSKNMHDHIRHSSHQWSPVMSVRNTFHLKNGSFQVKSIWDWILLRYMFHMKKLGRSILTLFP